MNKYFNEKGYALIVVLLTITMIFSVAGVLGMQAITSAKQINYSDDYVRLIDLAEMGSTYANSAIDKSLTESIESALESTTDITDLNGDGSISDDEKEAYIQNQISDAANKVVSNVSTTISVEEDNQYNVSVVVESITDNTVVFGITSTGENGENAYPIYYKITATIDGTDISTSVEPVSCSNGIADVEIEDGTYSSVSQFDNAKNQISNSQLSYTDVPGDISSDITFPTCTNHNSGLNVSGGANVTYEGSAKVTSTANFGTGSEITVNGNFYAPNGANFSESSAGYFNGYSYFNNLTLNKNSEVNVLGNVQVDNNFTLQDGAVMKVKESLMTQNFQNNDSDYVMKIAGNYIVSSNFSQKNGSIQVNGDFTTPNANIDGGDMTIYGDMNVQNGLNLNGGKVVVYGDLNVDSNFLNNNYKPDSLFNSKVIPFDKLSDLDSLETQYGDGKIYWYNGSEEVIAPPISVGSGNGGTGSGTGELNLEQNDVEYEGIH